MNIKNQLADMARTDLPPALKSLAVERLERFVERHGDGHSRWLADKLTEGGFLADLAHVWSCSSFVFDACLAWPEMFAELADSGDLYRGYGEDGFRQRLDRALGDSGDEKDLFRILRQFRRREMVRLVWRDFTRQAELLETTGDVTRLAEAAINAAIARLYRLVEARMGTPIGKYSGQPQSLVVLGMGKMGAWELNLSSDIDLIFAYPEDGETRGGSKQVSNQEFFLRLAQKLIQALDSTTVDGFVFRVDMRLRPYGESGALVLNFDAMEEYYQSQGRDWERYAMVKARAVAGRPEDGAQLAEILRPFTYRKYIDYSAIQSLRDMKSLINREVARLGGRDDVKKSAGGIREIEFIAQAFQLIRGGKDRRYQDPSLRDILRLLGEEGLLPREEAENLWSAYVFLRNTEHVLQGVADKQTQRLPDDDESRLIVAHVMGFADWQGFYTCLEGHREGVREIFAGIAAEAPSDREPSARFQAAKSLWQGARDSSDTLAGEMASIGLEGAEDAANLLVQLRNSRAVKSLSATVRERLDNFIPLLIDECAGMENGARALDRILPLVEAILRRSAYLVLLIENPDALRQLAYLCSHSLWIAEQIARFPALLDELLDPRTLFTPADKESIGAELQQEMLRVPGDDLDAQMEALRHFRRAQSLRIAACEVAGALPLMKVSDNLTWLAEVILERVLAMATSWMAARYGRPGRADGDPEPCLIIVGYGKLGGIELGHGSDLDLVFLHKADAGAHSDGERSIDNNSYFIRLCQRIIHILSTKTVGGDLYEVDTRLRPNGNSGLLVTSIPAFEKYQLESAWTWEHQALVRARVVAGDDGLASAFDDIRRRVVGLPRDEETLRREVNEMREKMRSHLGSSAADAKKGRFHVKQDVGGIVDLEFVVQFAVLANARELPDLTRWTDNMRILDSLEDRGVLTGGEASALRGAYIAYRSTVHRLQLQKQQSVVEGADQLDDFKHHRQAVSAVYRRLLGL